MPLVTNFPIRQRDFPSATRIKSFLMNANSIVVGLNMGGKTIHRFGTYFSAGRQAPHITLCVQSLFGLGLSPPQSQHEAEKVCDSRVYIKLSSTRFALLYSGVMRGEQILDIKLPHRKSRQGALNRTLHIEIFISCRRSIVFYNKIKNEKTCSPKREHGTI